MFGFPMEIGRFCYHFTARMFFRKYHAEWPVGQKKGNKFGHFNSFVYLCKLENNILNNN